MKKILAALLATAASAAFAKLPDVNEIVLEGDYEGHLQDVWYDGKDTLYWAHTEDLLKTDLSGRVLKRAKVEGHHAGIELKDGRLFIAVCIMQNKTGGKTTPECRVTVGEYDAETLDLVKMHVTDIHDRSGSLAILADGTFAVGCLRPQDISKSQVRFHHLDRDFKLIESRVLDNVPVKLGIEVIKRRGDDLYLNMYGKPGTIRLDRNFNETWRGELGGSCGLVFDGDDIWNGATKRDPKSGRYASKLVRRGAEKSPWWLLPVNGGGFVQNVQIAPSDPNVWYTYVDVGGPYRSNDAGGTWRPLHGRMSQTMRNCWADHIRTLLVDPRDADRFVFAAGWRTDIRPAGLYVSSDGGRTFRRTLKATFHGEGSGPGKCDGKVITRDPWNPDNLLAASDSDGIFRSRDGGESWTSCGCDDRWFVEIAYDRTVPGRAYACAAATPGKSGDDPVGFYRSLDGGRTWNRVSAEAPTELAQMPGSEELLGIFQREGVSELRVTSDGGTTWTPFMQGLPQAGKDDPNRAGRYQAIAAGKGFYLACNWIGRMFRREAGSAAWTEIPIESMSLSHPEMETGVARSVASKCRECTSDIMIDPRDERHVLTTDWFHIWESKDGGRNWRTRTNGMQQLVPFTIACDPNSPCNIAYGCADMGMFCSTNLGATYFKEHGICGANSIAWAHKAKHRAYAVGGKVGIQLMITENGGAKWRYSARRGLPPLGQKEGQHGIYTIAVDPTTDDVYVCVSGKVAKGKGGIYRSTDGGDSWTWFGEGLSSAPDFYQESEFSCGGPALWPEQLVFGPDGSAITFGPKTGKMFYLDRAAGRWEHVNVWCKGGAFTVAADPHVPGRFLMAERGRIVEFTEGGRKVNWYLPGSGGLGYALAFDPFTPGLVVSTTLDAEDICVSRDGGRHWSCLPGGMDVPTGTQHGLALDRKRLFLLTRGSGVWMRNLD